jgi:hypothetical protein
MQLIFNFFRRLFTPRNFLRLVFAFALLGALWAAFCIEERWRGRRAWESYRQAAMARGVPLEMGAVMPPKLPDEQNFAATPMIQSLFAAQEGGETPRAWFAVLKLDQVDQKRHGTRPFESPSMEAWRDHFVKSGILGAPGADPASDVLTALEIVRSELTELREAGRRPGSAFPVQWERGFSAGLPHVSALIQAANVYQLAIAAHLARGESAEAYGYFSDGLRLYSALQNEPALINGLVRISIVEKLALRVRDGIAAGRWQTAELERLQKDFAGLAIADDWRFALNSERALVNTALLELHGKSDSALAQLSDDILGGNPKHSSTSVTAVSLYPRGWFWLSQRKINEFFDRSIERVDLVESGKLFVLPSDADDDVERIAAAGPLKRLPYLLYTKLTPALGGVESKYLHAICTVTQAQTACALERHRLSDSNYPDRVQAIVPHLIPTLPVDPVAQAPMRYRTTSNGSGFELWSVALNRTDDGASELPDTEPRNQPDWVWAR